MRIKLRVLGIAIVVVALMLVLVACGPVAPVTGTVVEKEYNEAHTSIVPMMTYDCHPSYDLNSTVCDTNINYLPVYEDDSWVLVIETDEGKTVRREVSHEVYDLFEVGNRYVDEE